MKSNYKPIGKYIQEVKLRNRNNETNNLLGININKHYMPSVANIVGTDLSVYKIVRKGQFACNRMHVGRDMRLPIALSSDEDDFIVSPAYDVFEITDTTVLAPEYLMMWFTRSEFDRNAWFYTDADVRGGLNWKAFCEMQLPIPSITKQKEIVAEYNTIQNRIDLNKELIQKLEEAAQAIYKSWFVDFEFPDENGMPYQSNGGGMMESELGEIPEGWRKGSINELVNVIDGDRGFNYPSLEEMSSIGFCLFLNAGNVTKTGFNFSASSFISIAKDKSLRKGKLKKNDVVLTTRGTVGNVGYYSDAIPFNEIRINSGMVILRRKNFLEETIFVYSKLRNYEVKKEIENFVSGSAQPQLPIRDLVLIPTLIPSKDILLSFSKSALRIQINIDLLKNQNQKIEEFKSLLLSKLATIE